MVFRWKIFFSQLKLGGNAILVFAFAVEYFQLLVRFTNLDRKCTGYSHLNENSVFSTEALYVLEKN